MAFQFRILGSIGLLLLLALLFGAALLSLHARSVADIEVRTAFQGAEKSVRDTLKSDVEHTVTLRQVVDSFQGQRHVRAALINENGKIIVKSEIGRLADPAPAWFTALMQLPQMSSAIHINLRQYPCVVQLTSDPRSELAEAWGQARDAFVTMLLFCVATMVAVSLAVAYAVRFLRRFQLGLLAITDGSYDARLDQRGPPEFSALAGGFNHMASRLAALSESNRRLQQQIQNVQEEERVGIARDLHDEVGPYVFAIQVDANLLEKSTEATARELGTSIRDAALHIQGHVKDIMRRLRPVNSLDFGLEPAVADLVAFWSRRHPNIRFERAIAVGPGPGRRREEVAYRIVQESLSNAVRHGVPKEIRITIAEEQDQLKICVEDDGGGLKSEAGANMSLGQIGLVGMEERVHALDGQFRVEDMQGRGVRVSAMLPKTPELEHA